MLTHGIIEAQIEAQIDVSSVESQKGAVNIQRCSVENQKGTIAVHTVNGDRTLLVLSETSMNSDSALLVLNWRYFTVKYLLAMTQLISINTLRIYLKLEYITFILFWGL